MKHHDRKVAVIVSGKKQEEFLEMFGNLKSAFKAKMEGEDKE